MVGGSFTTFNGLSAMNITRIYGSAGVQARSSSEIFQSEPEIDTNPNYSAITIYPNPFDKYITVQFEKTQYQKLQFKLFDVTGKLILSEQITGAVTLQLPFNLPAGFYTYSITNDQTLLQSGKLIH